MFILIQDKQWICHVTATASFWSISKILLKYVKSLNL